MSSSKNVCLAMTGLGVVLVAVGVFVIAPNYRQAGAFRGQTKDLQGKIASLSTQTQALHKLAEDAETARRHVESELKIIPEGPDVASLMRKLSQVVDRVRVVDQTFNAGSPSEAIMGSKSSVQAMPLTVDMESTFDSVFALIQNAESMSRLVRIASVRVVCKRDEKGAMLETDAPIVKASIGLEAIFDVPNVAPTQLGGAGGEGS